MDLHDLQINLNKNSSQDIKVHGIFPIHGGDICDAYKIESESKHYFLKTHQPCMYEMLQCEATNLSAIAATDTIKTPLPISHGKTANYSFLLLEYLELDNKGSHAALGTNLAKLHQQHADYFGWDQNNWIGASTQPNEKNQDWISFYKNKRLTHQTELAKLNNAPHSLIQACEKLITDFDCLFDAYTPKASLLHGDLWSGNFAFIKDGTPVVYDPASYYGDHETDLAMTELFGGFTQDFYRTYIEHYPIDDGYIVRKDLYNLYHILNHFNLFAGGYATQAEKLCQKILSQI